MRSIFKFETTPKSESDVLKTIDHLDAEGNFTLFPIMPLLDVLLKEGVLAKTQEKIESQYIKYVIPYVTIEAALWITLAQEFKKVGVQ